MAREATGHVVVTGPRGVDRAGKDDPGRLARTECGPVDAGLRPLFTPVSIAGLDLANRFAMAPMTRWQSPGQVPGPEVASYYRRRAEGGVGLIITEGTTVDHPVASYSERVPAFHGHALEGWRRVVDQVHEAGARIVPQLWHVGAMRNPKQDIPNPHLRALSPSGFFKPGGKQIAQVMQERDIDEVCDAFTRAAEAARELGFDGIEIHGAHGYIIDQFLWRPLNLRDDAYGGDAVGRTAFAARLISRVRAAIGPDFPLILRISQWKQQDYEAKLAADSAELAAILAPLTEAGVDIFHCSQRRIEDSEFPGSADNLATWVKRLTGKPVITVGGVGLNGALSTEDIGAPANRNDNIRPLARAVERGDYDVLAVGRALLADPEWVRKIHDSRHDEIRRFDRNALEHLS